MSSSDSFPRWDLFTERDTPESIDLLSPSSEAAALLQALCAQLDSARADAAEAREAAFKPLADLAVLAWQLGGAVEHYQADLQPKITRHLRVIRDQMLSAVEKTGISVVSPLGLPFDDIADGVEVIGWRHNEKFTAQLVAEVLEPVVTCGGKLLRMGKVIMGGPPESAAEPEPTEVRSAAAPDEQESSNTRTES